MVFIYWGLKKNEIFNIYIINELINNYIKTYYVVNNNFINKNSRH
jgi:hypothetical protein